MSSNGVRNDPRLKAISNQKSVLVKKIKGGLIPELQNNLTEIQSMTLEDFDIVRNISVKKFGNSNPQHVITILIDYFNNGAGSNATGSSSNETKTQTEKPQTEKPQTENNSKSYFGDIPIIESDYRNGLAVDKLTYKIRGNEVKTLMTLSRSKSSSFVLLIGNQGTGKTQLAESMAKILGVPFVLLTMGSEAVKEDLLGNMQITKEGSTYIKGGFLTAIDYANNSPKKMSIIIADELTSSTNYIQKYFNENLNFERGITEPSLGGMKFTLNEGSKVIVIATGNPSNFGGNFTLNRELISRARVLEVYKLTKKENLDLMKNRDKVNRDKIDFDSLTQVQIDESLELSDQILNQFNELQELIDAEYELENLDMDLDTRVLLNLHDDTRQFLREGLTEKESLTLALNLNVYGHYLISGDRDQSEIVARKIFDVFNITKDDLRSSVFPLN